MNSAYLDDAFRYRRVAAAVVAVTVHDLGTARPQNPARAQDWRRNRVHAACWIASRGATLWLEGLGYDERADILRRCGWPAVVEDVLLEHRSGRYRLAPMVVKHLVLSLRVVGGEEASAA